MDIYECGEKLKALRIGDMVAKIPIIQGGMGVGISRSKLAGAVAAEGGIGIISTAQIGYDEDGFEKDQAGCNLLAIRKHIKREKTDKRQKELTYKKSKRDSVRQWSCRCKYHGGIKTL